MRRGRKRRGGADDSKGETAAIHRCEREFFSAGVGDVGAAFDGSAVCGELWLTRFAGKLNSQQLALLEVATRLETRHMFKTSPAPAPRKRKKPAVSRGLSLSLSNQCRTLAR